VRATGSGTQRSTGPWSSRTDNPHQDGSPDVRGEVRVRRGSHAHSGRGARRCRAARPLKGCTKQRLLEGPDGAGLSGRAPVTGNPDFPSRHPRTSTRRPAGAVGPSARRACHEARGRSANAIPLRAGNRLAPLASSSSQRPDRPRERHPLPANARLPARRPARVPNRSHLRRAPSVEPRTPPPAVASPCPVGACAAALAAGSRASRTTSDNYLHHGHLGDLLRVDFLEKVLSTLRALTRLDRLSCRPWRSNSTHG